MLSLLASAVALVPASVPSTSSSAVSLVPVSPAPLHCGACGFNSGEAFIHTLPGESMEKGRASISLRADLQEFDAFSDAELLDRATAGVFAHSIDRSLVVRAGTAYAVSDTWTVGADLPFVSNHDLREGVDDGGPDVELNGDQEGLGDLALFAQWKFHDDAQARVYASLYFGAELPTGKTDERSSGGERLEPDHQPGSGSVDAFAGLACTKGFGSSTFGASVLYTFAGDGSQDSNLGDVLRANAGFGWSPSADPQSAQWRWMLEVNAQWHERMRMDGAVDDDSGGVQVFLAPGLRVTSSSHVSWFASVGVPLHQDLHGEQSETDFRASIGVGFSL